MKYQLQILIFVLLCLVGKLDASSLYDYGLHLKSHTVSAIERTSLFLDDNQPFPIKNDFTISFQMYIRANEPDFGSILHLYTNTNQYIRFLFVQFLVFLPNFVAEQTKSFTKSKMLPKGAVHAQYNSPAPFAKKSAFSMWNPHGKDGSF